PSSAIVGPGQSARFALAVTGTTGAAPGPRAIPFQVVDTTSGLALGAEASYDLAAPRGCFVRPELELVVRDVSVVEDPARTSGQGAWTFAHLAGELAPAGVPPGAFVEAFLRTWLADQTVNGLPVRARPTMQPFALDPWPRDASGLLDLTRAPVRLLAIVDRVDLRDLGAGSAGEGRFVFGLLD